MVGPALRRSWRPVLWKRMAKQSPRSKDGSLIVSHPLTPSEIGWLRQQSKRVAAASSQRSGLGIKKSPSAGLKSAAAKVLANPKASQSAKSLAASVLTQTPMPAQAKERR